MNRKDNPGVHIPPPLIYAAMFFTAVYIQKFLPINGDFFQTASSRFIGWILVLSSLAFSFTALRQFFKTKNTLITIKAANSLQTTGIFSVSRNPMYMSLALLYTGLSFIAGNWWNFLLLPVLLLLIQEYVIKREEQYLARRFGQAYLDYRAKVRRWL